jgi:hypothetical protein
VSGELDSVTDDYRCATGVTSRNALLGAELEERLREAREPRDERFASIELALNGGRPITDEERDARMHRSFSEETSYECAWCRHVFVDGDVVYRRRAQGEVDFAAHWSLESICDDCVQSAMHPSWREHRREPTPCAGGCGVLVSDWYWQAITTCSRRCSKHAAAERRRVTHDERRCAVCDGVFTPKRSDARYCSNACKQDAYRKRKLGATVA